MDLNKCVIKGKYESEFYSKKTEVVNQDKCVLLGFKNNIPVLSNESPELRKSIKEMNPKKTLKVVVDAQTGEKFLNLNGKKLKMVTQSELPPHFKHNVQTIKSNGSNGILSKKPVKIKIVGSMSSILHGSAKLIKSSESQDVDNKLIFKPNVNNGDSNVSNKLSHKTLLIKGGTLPTVISSVGNVFAAGSTPLSENSNVIQDNGKLKSIAQFKIELNNIQTSDIKSYQRPSNMKALDLTILNKHKIFSNGGASDLKTFENKCVQTDAYMPVQVEKITKSEFVQTEERQEEKAEVRAKDFPDLSDLDASFLDYLISSPLPSVGNTLPTDIVDMIDKPTYLPQKIMKTTPQNRIDVFFKDLRAALLPDDKGNMPIHMGVLTNNLSLVKKNCRLLKALQKTVDLPNHAELTALQLAVINDSSPEILKTLLLNGASLEVTDMDGNNIVHLTVELERQNILEIVLKDVIKRNFDLDQFNAEGFTPLMICCSNGLLQCAELLLGHGADVNIRDKKSGRTPLFHAAENLNLDMVNLLLSYNADTKIKNFFGTSPHDAMYEVDEIPEQIKATILRKNSKRKMNEDAKSKLKKKVVKEKPLKTYAKLKKIEEYEFPNIDSNSSSLTN